MSRRAQRRRNRRVAAATRRAARGRTSRRASRRRDADAGTAGRGTARQRAAASPSKSVTLPVWIAERTGGHRRREAVAAPVAYVENVQHRERDPREHAMTTARQSERKRRQRHGDSAGSGGYGYGPPHAVEESPSSDTGVAVEDLPAAR